MSNRRRRQLELPIPPPPASWGGKRAKSGRKPNGEKAGVSHLVRPRFDRRFPVHVTVRLMPQALRLRNLQMYKVIRKSLAAGQRESFSVVEYAVMSNHLHLMIEADSDLQLSRGMQGLLIRLARGLNRLMGRKGKLFTDRYHARLLKTPLEVKRALLYVLNNARRHAAQHGRWFARGWVDPYSSGLTFWGWARPLSRRAKMRWLEVSGGERPPVARARSWLLATGWGRDGPLNLEAVPG